MKWISDNWSLLIVAIAAVYLLYRFVKRFTELPSDSQVSKVKEWLLFAVIEAEKELGSGTGALKLRYVYDKFVERFPTIVSIVSFETFGSWVDEALGEMRHLLETNSRIQAFVNNK